MALLDAQDAQDGLLADQRQSHLGAGIGQVGVGEAHQRRCRAVFVNIQGHARLAGGGRQANQRIPAGLYAVALRQHSQARFACAGPQDDLIAAGLDQEDAHEI